MFVLFLVYLHHLRELVGGKHCLCIGARLFWSNASPPAWIGVM